MFETQLQDFTLYLRFEKRYSSHTLSAYLNDLQQFEHYLAEQFGIKAPADVRHFHIRSWLAEIKADKQQATTLNRKRSSLNSFFKFLQNAGFVNQNPVKLLHAQRLPERLPVFLKVQEAEDMIDELNYEEGLTGLTEKLICEILYDTGMRRAEIINLKDSDIEWGLKQIRILGKGNKERLMPVGEAILDQIRDYQTIRNELPNRDTCHLLVTKNGKPLYPMYVHRIVNKHMAQTSTLKKKSPHVLRHTFATHLLNNGANIQAIKDLLGHTSLAATQIYTHNNIDKLKEVHRQNHPRG